MQRATVWTFDDLGFFLGAIVPSVFVASYLSSLLPWIGARALAAQMVLYVLLLSVLYVLARVRHNLEFGKAVQWTMDFRFAWTYVVAAPLLALSVSVMGVLLRAPLIPNAIDQLTALDVPFTVIALFAVMLGPMFEELVFRGFLQPLLESRWGSIPGLLAASTAFSLLHGAQNAWLWQYLVLLFFAGLAFGLARQRTNSTAAAFLLHMGFNLTQVTASMVQRG
jgi:membrane protease YdiL (CAAX protease family)